MSKAQALHRKQFFKKLSNAKTKNPKFYWSALNRQCNIKRKKCNSPISLNDFFTGFKTLSGTNSHGDFNDRLEDLDETFDVPDALRELADQILNSEITVEEIYLRVKDLKMERHVPRILY